MKLSKKWLMVIALVMSLTVATAGTLAYLTDRDTVENTFTVGNVDIEVEEEFEQDSPLNPGVEVEKQAGIKNVHATEPAYVWMTVSVPEALAEYITLEWDGVTPEDCEYTVHDGYVSYLVKHDGELTAGASTPKYLKSVTLSEKVDYQNGAYVIVEDGEIKATIGSLDDVKIIVDGFATQTEGFADVNEAYDAYTTQWDGLNGGMSTGTPVDTVEDLLAALENGTADDIVYTGSDPVVIDTELTVASNTKINLSNATLQFANGGKLIADNGVEILITDAEIVADGSDTIFEVTKGSVVTLGDGTILEDVAAAPQKGLFNVYNYYDGTSKLVLDGAKISANNNNGTGHIFNICDNSELVIEDGTVISNNTVTGKLNVPFALFQLSSNGLVTMNGGEISGNNFGDKALIVVSGSGKFVLNDGKITDNTFTGTGSSSIIYLFSSTSSFEMNGGEITSNNVGNSGYVLSTGGGDAYIHSGLISGNTVASNFSDTWGDNVTVDPSATVQ